MAPPHTEGMKLSRKTMVERMLASDASYDGKFITGVLTTGIYCLPSCRARKPKPENVVFFETPDQARATGLRACLKCRPDEKLAGIDPDLDLLEAAINAMRADPSSFPTVEDVAKEFGYGVSTLASATRRHYHDSPGNLLLSARIDTAKRLLVEGKLDAAEVGFAVGFDSTSGFYDSFRRLAGMSPGAYAKLGRDLCFTASLPTGHQPELLLDNLGRDPLSVIEQREGNVFRVAVRKEACQVVVQLEFEASAVNVLVDGEPGDGVVGHRIAAGLIGWERDPGPFEALVDKLDHSELIEKRRGIRIPQTPSLWDGLCWVVIGQQISLPFAYQMRRSLAILVNGGEVDGLVALPSAGQVAQLDADDLLKLKFSRKKAEYLIDIARLIVSGELDEATFRGLPATKVEQRLLAVRGLGPWSVNYLMMRSLGFADCVPFGDTGLNAGLRKLFGLSHRPGVEEQQALMARFTPYRSLATFHLWQSLKDQ